jgi:hypothetical protein
MPNWFLVSTTNTNLAIQAGATAGSGVTLETFDANNQFQQWQAQFQVANGYAGVAFVNSGSGTALSVTFNGQNQQLVMQTFSPQAVDQDAWLLVQAGAPNAVRVTWPPDQSWSWNDLGGGFNPGDSIALWNDQNPNSVWSLIYQ